MTEIDPRSELVYQVTAQDDIVFVNDAWDTFASLNHGAHLQSSQLVQRSLWDFISGATVQHLYRELLRQVRAGRSIQFSFRCDSATYRRVLSMHIEHLGDGAVQFCTNTLSEEARPAEPLLDPHTPRSSELVRMCSWCKKIWADECWVDIEDAVDSLRLFEHAPPPALTHSVCTDCHRDIIAQLDTR